MVTQARAQGMPMMVTVISTAASSHIAAVTKPRAKMFHRMFSSSANSFSFGFPQRQCRVEPPGCPTPEAG